MPVQRIILRHSTHGNEYRTTFADSAYVTDEQLQPELNLQSFTYQERGALIPDLGAAIDSAGGWVLDRRPTSANAMEMYLEVAQAALPEVYGALLGSGLELTRESHRALAERCTCGMHLSLRNGLSSILTMRIEVTFLQESAHTTEVARLIVMGAALA